MIRIQTIRITIALAASVAAMPSVSEPLVLAKAGKKPAAAKPARASLELNAVNDAATAVLLARGASGGAVLRAQVLLDRARFSPGEIDAAYGTNMRKAVAGYQKARGLEASGVLDPATGKLLNADTAPVLVRYTIRPEDVAGPFREVPEDMMEKSKLSALGYANAFEAIAEKFHSSPKLLARLNPGRSIEKAGEEILVPNVRSAAPPKAAKVVVDASALTVAALDAEGNLVAQYPATVGSENDPLPVGNWKVNGVSKNPPFHYNPDLFWDAEASHAKAKIAPGPNNPVGVVWIDLSRPHYGIHGTTIGKTQSHGCIRLTNWDAAELAQMVAAGTPAVLQA